MNNFIIYTFILILLYIIKLFLNIKLKNKILSTIFFTIPIIFFYVLIVYQYEYGCCDLPPARWIGAPLAYLFIPIISYIIDLFLFKNKKLLFHIIKSVIEILINSIIWIPLWGLLHFVFGWVYI